MAEGKIKRWFPDKGYGFITPDDDSQDVKFFADNLQEAEPSQMAEGLRVQYELRRKADRPTTYQFWLLDLPAKPQTVQRQESYHFLNPYNFVRTLEQPRPQNHVLGNCPPPPHDRYVGLSGRITCTVEVVTPLFISDSHAIQEDNGHKTYRFFQYEGQPALPASSLRGMFRSVFEAVTNSCFSVFDPGLLDRREAKIPEGAVPARVVEVSKDGAKLEVLDASRSYPSHAQLKRKRDGRLVFLLNSGMVSAYEPHVLDTDTKECFDPQSSALPSKAQDGWRVAAQVDLRAESKGIYQYFLVRRVVPIQQEQQLQATPGIQKVYGYLHITGPNIEKKHFERLFFRWDDRGGPQVTWESIPQQYRYIVGLDVVEEYNSHLQGYWERNERQVKKLGDKPWPIEANVLPHPSEFIQKGRRLREGDLVYYIPAGTLDVPVLRPVSIARQPFTFSRGESLQKHAEHLKHCGAYEQLCPACRVWGWVHEKAAGLGIDKPVAYAGRVRFSHGKIEEPWQTEDEIRLAILSTPKPTTTAFYLLNSEGQPDATATYDTDGARLRGRKVYRHQGQASSTEYTSNDKTDQNRTVQGALKPGATFTFTLDFENLAPLELGALLYALELEEGMFHRLGYAKSLGFGSVKVRVESVKTIDWQRRLQSVDLDAGWKPIDGAQLKQAFLQNMRDLYGGEFDEVVADLRALLETPPDLPIHYPRPTRQFDSDHPQYEWFMGNKRRIGKRGKDLPEPVVLDLAKNDTGGLPLIEKDGREGH